jgi:hypothetical protein
MSSLPYLDLQHLATPARLTVAVGDRRAWTRESLRPVDWTVPLGSAAQSELHRMAAFLRANPLATPLLSHEQFDLPACRAAVTRIKGVLDDGCGIAVLDRLDLDALSRAEASQLYWILGGYLAPRVAQKWDGTMVYDVKDTGRAFGYGVRASWTNVELFFHTDNPFGVVQPDYVSLLCLQPAEKGGMSRFCSLYMLHNRLLERYPRQLERLYRPVLFDRQAEHAPDEPKVALAPPLVFDGQRLRARLSVALVRKGYALADRQMDAVLAEALDVLDDVLRDESLWVEFLIERGQMQYLNNHETAHFRSEFSDAEAPERKRHLIRLWYRNAGRTFYNG